ncbi:threonyl-tRNA synthetase editing domain-containing protein [Nocardia sp. NPDC023852]|uniref:threonyl-tRNA synthetase editing domain-containing protein n=1 Tax=Nocardia sp. NPDC023852 TaxID=3154697 RepID=UPI0033D7A814
MKIFSSRCRTFEYTVTTASPSAIWLEPAKVGVAQSFSDCLALMIGVERGDLSSLSVATKMIRRVVTKTDATSIVINGFSHLATPGNRSDVAISKEVLSSLSARLEARGERVHLMPFGWNKRWNADVLDGEWEQRVIHLPAPGMDPPSATVSQTVQEMSVPTLGLA